MVELNFANLHHTFPHAIALTGPRETARLEADKIASTLVADTRLGVLLIEPDGPAIKLEAAHKINDFLSLSRLTKARVIIVVDAHLLNAQATNALLKIVEEPPPGTHFLFLTPEVSQLLPTLRSRVQVIRLRPEPRVLDEELFELRDSTKAFAQACFSSRRAGVSEFLEATKDRESAVEGARLLQHLLRDWSVGEDSHGFPDDWAPYHRVELWRAAHQIELDLHGNVDRSLVFENFFYKVNESRHVD